MWSSELDDSLFEMDTEKLEQRLDEISQQKAHWSEMIKQWEALTPFAPIPMYTREHAEKMIKKLKKEESRLGR